MKAQSIDFVESFLQDNDQVFSDSRKTFYYSFKMPFFKKDRPSGVYLLGDFYVGKSIDYAARILNHRTHIKESIKRGKAVTSSAEGALKWFSRFGPRKIPVFHLSNYPQDEYLFARKLLDAGFNIVNDLKQCDGYYRFHMTDKEADSVRYLQELGYEIEVPGSRRHLIIPNNQNS